jgi:hypothetical protein
MPDEDPELRADDTVFIDLTPYKINNKYGDQNNPDGNGVAANGFVNGGNGTATATGNMDANGANVNGVDNSAGRTNNKNSGNKNNYDYGRIVEEGKAALTDEEKEKLEKLRQLILRNNPYHLNRFGVLELPGLPAIPLAGLTADEATNRLSADPDLRDFTVKLTLLRLQPFDEEALKPFGYDLFEGVPSTFAPVSDIQVPMDYLVGPGDTLNVQLYGNEPATLYAHRGAGRAHQLPETRTHHGQRDDVRSSSRDHRGARSTAADRFPRQRDHGRSALHSRVRFG